jgi:hypothetical protein
MPGEAIDDIPFKRTFKLSTLFAAEPPPSYCSVSRRQKAAIAFQRRLKLAMSVAAIMSVALLGAVIAASLPFAKVPAWKGVPIAFIFVCALFALADLARRLRRKAGSIAPESRFRNCARQIPSPFLFLLFSIFVSGLILAPVLAGHRTILDTEWGVLAYGIGPLFLAALIAAKLTAGGKQK